MEKSRYLNLKLCFQNNLGSNEKITFYISNLHLNESRSTVRDSRSTATRAAPSPHFYFYSKSKFNTCDLFVNSDRFSKATPTEQKLVLSLSPWSWTGPRLPPILRLTTLHVRGRGCLREATQPRLTAGLKPSSSSQQVHLIDRRSNAVWYWTGSDGGDPSGERE